jgi:hypothetical protein
VKHGVRPDFDEMVDYGDSDSEFVLGRGSLSPVRFDLSLDAEPVFALAAIGGFGQSLQFEHLADGTKRDLNGAASSDLSAFSP